MKIAPIPGNEKQRLEALKSYEILDTNAEEIFDSITYIAAMVCNTPISLINLIDANRQFVKSVHGDMSDEDTPRDFSFCSHVINQHDLLEVKDAAQDERFFDNPFVTKDPKLRFYAGAPLTTNNKYNLGALCVIGRKPQQLTPVQKDILQRLSHIVMTLFEARKSTLSQLQEKVANEEKLLQAKALLEKNLKDMQLQHKEMSLLSELSRILQACRIPEEAYTSLEAYCKQIFPHANGSICIIQTTGTLVSAKSWGKENYSKNYFTVDECWGLRRSQFYKAADSQNDLVCKHYEIPEGAGKVATICIPLMAQGEFTGLLTLQFSCEDSPQVCMGDHHQLLAIALAEQTALALANINLRASLFVLSHSDPLTGLFTQRLLQNEGNTRLQHADMNHQSAALILLDIDEFKKINDTHGHEAGNIILQKVAELLKMNARPGEVAYRLDNDEMILLLPDTTTDAAFERAESLRKAASHLHIRYNGAPLQGVTVSIGVVTYPEQADSVDSLLLKAKRAVNYAKKNGGNAVERLNDKNS